MANEIKISGSLRVTKGVLTAQMTGQGAYDMSGSHYHQSVENIGLAEETLDKGDVGTIGYVMFKNAGSAGIIRIGPATGAYSITLESEEAAGPLKWAAANVFAICDDATGQLEYLMVEA